MQCVCVVHQALFASPSDVPPSTPAGREDGDLLGDALLGDEFADGAGHRSGRASPASSFSSELPHHLLHHPPRVVSVWPPEAKPSLSKDLVDFCFPDAVVLRKQMSATPLSHISPAATGQLYTFTLTSKAAERQYGFCFRFREVNDIPTRRIDCPSADVTLAVICILSSRPYFRLFGECLSVLHWIHHTQPAAFGSACTYLTTTLSKYWATPPSDDGPPPPRAALWRGLQRALSPAVPPHLTFFKERVAVPTGQPDDDLREMPLTPLLSRLSQHSVMALLTALWCERRIVMVSRYLPTLTACVHAARSLLFPFEWANLFVPIVPPAFLPYCCAPSPFLVGIRPSQFRELQAMEVGELVVVNLDEGYLAVVNGGPPLPDVSGGHPCAVDHAIAYSGPPLDDLHSRSGTTKARAAIDAVFRQSPSGLLAGGQPDGVTEAVVEAIGTYHRQALTATFGKDAVAARVARVQYFAALRRRRSNARRRSSIRPRSSSRASVTEEGDGSLSKALTSTLSHLPSTVTDFDQTASVVPASTPRDPFTDSDNDDDDAFSPSVGSGSAGGDGSTLSGGSVSSDSNEEDQSAVWQDFEATVGVTPGMRDAGADGRGQSVGRRFRKSTLSMGRKLKHRIVSSKLGQKLGRRMRELKIRTNATSKPGLRLYQELAGVYQTEKDDGAFDEQALRAAVLAFVIMVFGRVDEFVSLPAAATAGGRGRSDVYPVFDRAAFVRVHKHPTIARLLKEMMHAQLLENFATAQFDRRRGRVSGFPSKVLNAGISELVSSSGPGSSATTFGTVMRLCRTTLFGSTAAVVASTPTGGSGSGSGSGSALPSSPSSVSSASGGTPLTPRGSLSLAVSDLRQQLVIITSNHPRAPPLYPSLAAFTRKVYNNATVASFHPEYATVVLGVLWDRLNDAYDDNVQHGVRALALLRHLLAYGSLKCAYVALNWLPLLRLYILPSLHSAVLAAELTAHGSAWPAVGAVLQAASLTKKTRQSAAGRTRAAVAAVSSSGSGKGTTRATQHGLRRLAAAAARVYRLLVSPSQLMAERTIAASQFSASAIRPPYPYPLCHASRTRDVLVRMVETNPPVERATGLAILSFSEMQAMLESSMPVVPGSGGGKRRSRVSDGGGGGSAAALEGDLLGLGAEDVSEDAAGPAGSPMTGTSAATTVRAPRVMLKPPVGGVGASTPMTAASSTPGGESSRDTANSNQASGWLDAADGFEDWSTPPPAPGGTAASGSRFVPEAPAVVPPPDSAPASAPAPPVVVVPPPPPPSVDPASVFDRLEGVLKASPAAPTPSPGGHAVPVASAAAAAAVAAVGGGVQRFGGPTNGFGAGGVVGPGQVLYPPPVPNVVPDPRFYTPRSVVPASHIISPRGIPMPASASPPQPPRGPAQRPSSDPFAGL